MGCGSSSAPVSRDTVKATYVAGLSARGEPIYALCNYAKKDHVRADIHLLKFVWRTKVSKNTGEMGGFPTVLYKDVQRQQLGAIIRMIGIENGQYDPTDWKQAMRIDWIVDTWGDMTNILGAIFLGGGNKQQKYADAMEKKYRPFLIALEKQLNDLGTRFIAADKVTIADCCVLALLRSNMTNPKGCAQPHALNEWNSGRYPKLQAYFETLKDAFADFLANNPATAI